MNSYSYPLRSLLPDYARGAAGLLIGGGGGLLAPSTPHTVIIFGGLTALFLLFTLRTISRHRAQIEVTDESITMTGLGAKILNWKDLTHVKLRYYSTRRNRSEGWMTLKLGGSGKRIALDSALDGFDAIAARSVRAIRENDIAIDETTLANFAALGLAPGKGTSLDATESSAAIRGLQ